jgi:hypothetical protein
MTVKGFFTIHQGITQGEKKEFPEMAFQVQVSIG